MKEVEINKMEDKDDPFGIKDIPNSKNNSSANLKEDIEMIHLGKDVDKNSKKLLFEIYPAKTKFYCSGRLLTGPDKGQFLIAFFMLFIPGTAWFIFV